MEIKLNTKYNYELVYEAENVKVVEDATERVKILELDITDNDIKEEVIYKFTEILSELLAYRRNPVDLSDLVEIIFDSSTEQGREELLKYLNNKYEDGKE